MKINMPSLEANRTFQVEILCERPEVLCWLLILECTDYETHSVNNPSTIFIVISVTKLELRSSILIQNIMKNYKLNYFQCYSLYGFQSVFLPKSRIVLQFFFSSFFCIFLTIRKTIVTDFVAIVGVFIARRK